MKLSDSGKRVLLYGVLVLCLCGFAYVQGKAAATDQLTLDRAQALLGTHQGYLRALGALRDSEAGFVRLEALWRAKAESIGRQYSHASVGGAADTVTATSAISGGTPPLAEADSLRVVFLGRALDACDASRSVADASAALCKARGDSLEASLRAVLAVKSCRVLGVIPCPSRGALFVLGAVSGALLEHRLTH